MPKVLAKIHQESKISSNHNDYIKPESEGLDDNHITRNTRNTSINHVSHHHNHSHSHHRRNRSNGHKKSVTNVRYYNKLSEARGHGAIDEIFNNNNNNDLTSFKIQSLIRKYGKFGTIMNIDELETHYFKEYNRALGGADELV